MSSGSKPDAGTKRVSGTKHNSEVFTGSPIRATLPAGVVVTDAEKLRRTVARAGGTGNFKARTVKVNVEVNVDNKNRPLTWTLDENCIR